MAISGQSFRQLVTSMVGQAKASASAALDFTLGSVNLALVQAVAAVALWLEALVLAVLAQSRASTSQGADLDTWMADFGFARLGAVAATGQITFARFQPTAAAIVPVGAVVATAVGGAQFLVIADPTNTAFSVDAGGSGVPGYTVAANVPSITVAGQAALPGSAGNILAGAISLLLQPIAGIDTATNATPFVGGTPPESDAVCRARFQAFIGALMKGTEAAYAYALSSLQAGLTFQILDGTAPDLTAQPGFVTICLDDGTGNPPASLIGAARSAVEAVRCAGITVAVIPPQIVQADIAMVLSSIVAAKHAADVTAVGNALQSYINALPVGVALSFTRLTQIAYDASPNIANVTGVTLNGGTGDLAVTVTQVVKAGALGIV